MGKDMNPWRSGNFDPDGKIGLPGYGRKRSSSTLYPFFADGFSLPLNSSTVPPPNPVVFTSCQKSYVVFDQPGDRTSTRNGPEREDAYSEDPEDIDALLYSDSNNESEASTGHSPVSNAVAGSSAVLTPSPPQLPPPPKRRRVGPESDLDPSLADTASSTLRGGDEGSRKSKRERIKENLGVIRRLIPGWRKAKRKDAMAVLDEAIKYLNSLRLKTKEFGVGSE